MSQRWRIVTVIAALLLGWVFLKAFIGMARFALWFTLLGAKLAVVLAVVIIAALVYLRYRAGRSRP